MRHLLAVFIAIAALAPAAHAVTIDPIPGSLVYPTQPKTKLRKAPVGSIVQHNFYSNGVNYNETYRVLPDRRLKLLNRRPIIRE
ncbi:hypothetical protein SAMN03159496_02325 [Rhizobium sp. NFR07]|jgi:hypothetical protein|uniref:hypothetical protein n=1 Tax=Rhizobium sp. NFR07 TaxID=1566262 RepID=UPI0008F11ADD|nr:hypothetical protein [Rhizobium sp. NFR07]SFB20100.1 hypothetical protein SAMN03159496_02325 [Rhizobium sp. NFR07]